MAEKELAFTLIGMGTGVASTLFAAGKYFGRFTRAFELLEQRVNKLEKDSHGYAKTSDVDRLNHDIADRRQELDERMNGMATTRDLAALKEIIQVQSTQIQREVEQARLERHSDRRTIDEVNRNVSTILQYIAGRER